MTLRKRRDDYWGKDLPIKRGFDNFDEIKVEYYRDADSYFEAFKKGLFDVHPRNRPDPLGDAIRLSRRSTDGRVVQESFPTQAPEGR